MFQNPGPNWMQTLNHKNSRVDKHASQHLLSLLQQGTNMIDSSHLTTLVHQETVTLSENFCFTSDTTSYKESGIHDASAEATSTVQTAKNSLALEASFGTAFMKELQSAEAPVSAQRGCSERITANISDPRDLQFSHNDASSLLPSIPKRDGPNTNDGTGSISAYAPETESSNNQEICVDSESLRAADFYLPEESNLVIGNDDMNPGNSELCHLESEAKNEALLPSNMKDNIGNKLAAQNSIPVSDLSPFPPGVDGLHPRHGPYNQKNMNPSYQGSHGRPSSPLPHHLIGQTRPLAQQLDPPAHINPQMNFMGPNNVHPDPRHPYPPNMIHHQFLNNVLGSQFDPASHFQMLQHMQLPGNFPPPQMQDNPRGRPPSHLFDHASRFHELNQMMNPFLLHHHQQDYGGRGMEMPGPGIRRRINRPETMENLYQLEMRTNSRQPTCSRCPHPW